MVRFIEVEAEAREGKIKIGKPEEDEEKVVKERALVVVEERVEVL